MSNKEDVLLKIGNEIKKLRTEAKYSQEKLAELSGVDRTFIGSIERGEKNLSIFTLVQIIDVFELDFSTFVKNAYGYET